MALAPPEILEARALFRQDLTKGLVAYVVRAPVPVAELTGSRRTCVDSDFAIGCHDSERSSPPAVEACQPLVGRARSAVCGILLIMTGCT